MYEFKNSGTVVQDNGFVKFYDLDGSEVGKKLLILFIFYVHNGHE